MPRLIVAGATSTCAMMTHPLPASGHPPGSPPAPRWMNTNAAMEWVTQPSNPPWQAFNSKIRYFIPLGENLEIWELTVKNLRPQEANLSVFATVEFCLWDAMDDATNFQRNYSVGEVEVVDGVIYHKTEYRERRNHFAFFSLLGEAGRLRYRPGGFPGTLSRLGCTHGSREGDAFQFDCPWLAADRSATCPIAFESRGAEDDHLPARVP